MTPDECEKIGGHCYRFTPGPSDHGGSFTGGSASTDRSGVTETCAHCGTRRITSSVVERRVRIVPP